MNTMIKVTSEYLASQGLSQTFESRFWNKVKTSNCCWLWSGAIDERGYGSINSCGPKKFTLRAHVASWVLNYGPVPKGKHVLHDCPHGDNKLCVNPAHLYLGGNAENGRDRSVKKQACSGERHPTHKLTWDAVGQIRKSKLRQVDLAKKFGVHQSIISEVLANKRWKI